MKVRAVQSKLVIFFLATRPKFLVASVMPVLVGSSFGYATAGAFEPVLFVLALFGIMALHSGANVTNDYFDHISGNDWVNRNPTPFSGGRRFIQENVLSARATLIEALVLLAVGSAIGAIIVILTKSIFILILGLISLPGGYFYTASPIRLGYRSAGELVIALLFGLLPVFGSYYLQTRSVDVIVLLPACIVGILIFLVILINEFPDAAADAAVNKRTLVVSFGVPVSVWIYRIALAMSFIVAAVMLFSGEMFFAGLFYLFTLPVAIVAIRFANKRDLVKPGWYRASQITVILHTVGSVALSTGFLVQGLFGTGTFAPGKI